MSIFVILIQFKFFLALWKVFLFGWQVLLYNNTPSKAIVDAASNITHRPLKEVDDTSANRARWYRRCTLTHFWDIVTLLFEQWIIFKNLQFILLFLNIWTLTFYCFRLKNVLNISWDFRVSNHCWAFSSLFDFQNFHLTTQLLWPHCYTLLLVYITLDSKLWKKISIICLKKQYTRHDTSISDLA